MKLFTLTTLLAVASCLVSAATPSAKTFAKCYTGRTSISVKSVGTFSVSYTYTRPVYLTTTVTPTSTITPAAVGTITTTTTTTTSTTTLAQVTNTVTQTETGTTTTTITAPFITATEITTIVSTVTSTTDTTTVSTSSGFLPVSTTLQNSKKRSARVEPEHALTPRHGSLFARTSLQMSPAIKKGQTPLPSYPKSVLCYKFVVKYAIQTVTKTVKTTATTTLKPSTSTTTATQTVTATSTVVPPGATTTTYTTITSTTSTTTTPVTTTTSTVTATETLVVAQSTYYAACAPVNIVSTVNDQDIATYSFAGGADLYTTESTAYDCCVSCITNPNCITSGYTSDQICILDTAASCSREGQYSLGAYYSNAYYPYTLSNGNCGFFDAALPY